MHCDSRLPGLDKTRERLMKAVATLRSRHSTALPKMLDFISHEAVEENDLPKAPRTV